MKKFIKNNIKLLIAFILGGIFVGSSVYVIATTYYSINVVYNNANSTLTATNVEDALDELYRKSVGPIITSIVDNEDLTATVNITVTVNSVKSVCVNSSAKTTDDCTWKSVSGTSFNTNAVASAGNYYVHIQDTGGRITHSSSVSLTITTPTYVYYGYTGSSSTDYTQVIGSYGGVFRADSASSDKSAVCGLVNSSLYCIDFNTDMGNFCSSIGGSISGDTRCFISSARFFDKYSTYLMFYSDCIIFNLYSDGSTNAYRDSPCK